ncbi:phage head completion-stabilization protein [Yokenella regensburgei ATCC 49455]|nr:phage head completion-stabilization protein [Yokenella regensburgei ATCC 49455]
MPGVWKLAITAQSDEVVMATRVLKKSDAQQDAPVVVNLSSDIGDAVIKNTFFFPDVDPARIRKLMRLKQCVSPLRLRQVIKTVMAEINAELYDYRAQQMAAGFELLADVPAVKIDDESERVFYYLKAVTALATATLSGRNGNMIAAGNNTPFNNPGQRR